MPGLFTRFCRRRISWFAVLPLALALTSPSAQAQSAPSATGPSSDTSAQSPGFCPGSPLTRVPVYVALDMIGRDAPPIPPSVANLLQAVADRVDTQLHAQPNAPPVGEPRLTWRNTAKGLNVTWYRDGRLVTRIDQDRPQQPHVYADSIFDKRYAVGAHLLDSAFAAAKAAGDLYMSWPDIVAADTIAFRLSFVSPTVGADGKLSPAHAAMVAPAPVFTVGAPVEEVATNKKRPSVRYPMQNLDERVSGVLLVKFVVDTNGRADPTTVEDIWPEGLPRLTGDKGRYYDAFLAAVRDEIGRSTFNPARVGNCKVRQMIEQPFTFKMR